MNFLKAAYDGFWDEGNWFPPGVNWTTLKSTPEEKYPEFGDLKYPLLYAIVVLAVRTVFEWSIAKPIGRFFGLRGPAIPLPNEFMRLVICVRDLLSKLATIFSTTISNVEGPTAAEANGHLVNNDQTKVTSTSKTPVKRHSTAKYVPKSPLDKFSECCWRFTFYSFIFVYGLITLWDKPWFWNVKHCWYGYPFQPISMDIYWYYMFEFSFYISLIFSQFFDVQRNDFWVNFVHHIVTVILLAFSYIDNFSRVGSLVLITHDAADPWLEATKMARYCHKRILSNACFGIFTTIWLITRCGFLPFWILYSTAIDTAALIGFYSAYYFFNALLLSLQTLHVLWTVIIIKGLVKALKSGEFEDTRSDSEADSEDENERGKGKND